MLPPVLEIFVVWHPDDRDGGRIAEELVAHYRGTAFSGLIGGAVEIYVRSEGWSGSGTAPRPIAGAMGTGSESEPAELTVVVPVVGLALARSVENGTGGWHEYIEALVAAHEAKPESFLLLPVSRTPSSLPTESKLSDAIGHIQLVATPVDDDFDEVDLGRLARDIGQATAQLASGSDDLLTIFVSHTKRAVGPAASEHALLIQGVRQVIAKTRLREFFDTSDLQPGRDWGPKLEAEAASSALLVVRTDLYASRRWCQHEVRIAKQARMPVVILDALDKGEERGSFLMDHVPSVAGPGAGLSLDQGTIARVLDQLVDECLKRALWDRQQALAQTGGVTVAWWAAHAPEPVTFSRWLREVEQNGGLPSSGPIRVLHPDPPLGPDELLVLNDIAALAGLEDRLEVLTPRSLASRGASA